MKHFLLGIFLFSYSYSFAQWPTFNQAHPVSCQWPPYNYTSHGVFENVFSVDETNNYFDGYLAFGVGVLCNPDSTSYYRRNFSSKLNTSGELMYWNRYDNDTSNFNENWFYYSTPSHGGMCLNNSNEIVSVFSTTTGLSSNTFEDTNYLVGMNMNGEMQWKYLIDNSADKYGFSKIVENTSDTSYYTVGWYLDSIGGQSNQESLGSLIKMDNHGNILWRSVYSNVSNLIYLSKASDNGFWLTGVTPLLNDCIGGWYKNYDMVVIKTDSAGNEEGRLSLGGPCGRETGQIFELPNGDAALIGRLTAENSFGEDGDYFGSTFSTIIEQQQDGSIIQIGPLKQYLSSFSGIFDLAIATADSGYYVLADNYIEVQYPLITAYKRVGTLMKLNSQRDSIWAHQYSYYNSPPPIQSIPSAEHYILDAKITPDGGLVCCGYINQGYYDPNPSLKTPWIFKVDSMGCIEPGCQYVDVEEIVIGLENTINAFPNPAHDIVNLAFTFPADFILNNQNEIVVIDMQGREVLRQAISLFPSTTNNIEINISSLSSGMYTLHWLSNEAWLDSVKVVVE